MYASHLGTKLSKEPLPRSSADGGARRAEPQRRVTLGTIECANLEGAPKGGSRQIQSLSTGCGPQMGDSLLVRRKSQVRFGVRLLC